MRRLILALVLFLAAPAFAQEALCNSLGATCLCSEPMNAPTTIPAATNVTPPDSKKHCGAFYSQFGGSVVAAFGFPSGASVSYVYQLNAADSSHSSATSELLSVTGVNLTVGTFCTRLYQRFSSDFPDQHEPNPTTRAKLMQIYLEGGAYQSQMEVAPGNYVQDSATGWGIDESIGFGFSPPVGGTKSGQVTQSEIKSSWVRTEQCIDKDSSGIVHARGRVVNINTGNTVTFISGPTTSAHTEAADTNGSSTTLIGNLFRQAWVSPESAVPMTGSRYVSYGIAALFPYSTTQWIGAASEVEGGAPSTVIIKGPTKITGPVLIK